MMALTAPAYTQVPNVFLDEKAKNLSEAELRVCLVVCRRTFGWHKKPGEGAELSISFLEQATGMSKQGVINACKSLLENGVLEKTTMPGSRSNFFSFVINEQSTALTITQPPTVNGVDYGQSTALTMDKAGTVNVVDTKKEKEPKEKENKGLELPPELDSPEFREAWADWCADRKERKKPVTSRAAKLQLTKLAGWGAVRAVAAIRHSIEKGWQGVYEEQAAYVRGQRPPVDRGDHSGLDRENYVKRLNIVGGTGE